MVVVGAAAARGDDPILPIVVAASLGAIVGDTISCSLGRVFGMRLIRRWEFVRTRPEPSVDRSRRFFERYGGAAVFFGRFVGALRAVVPAVAAMSGMSYPRFLPWNVAGAVAWTSIVLVAGFMLGERVTHLVDRAGTAITVTVIVALAIAYGLTRWRRSRTASEAP